MYLGNKNAPGNGQFQRWPRSQGQIFWEKSCNKKWPSAIWKLWYLFFRCYGKCLFFFLNRSNVKVKRFSANPTIRSYILMWNIKALALANKMSTRLKYSKSRPDSKVKSWGQKCWYPCMESSCLIKYLCEI